MSFLINPFILGIGTPSDSYWANVSTLLHFEGANASTTFTCQKGKTYTANGDAQITTSSPLMGSASGLFDGAGDWVETPDHADLQFGSGDFTIECLFEPSGYAANEAGTYAACLLAKDKVFERSYFLQISGTSSSWTSIEFYGFDSGGGYQFLSYAMTINNGTKYLVSVSRIGADLRLFIDGVQVAINTSWTTSLKDDTSPLIIGAQNFDATYKHQFNGKIDELRITKGIGRYSGNYTPDTSPFLDQ